MREKEVLDGFLKGGTGKGNRGYRGRAMFEGSMAMRVDIGGRIILFDDYELHWHRPEEKG